MYTALTVSAKYSLWGLKVHSYISYGTQHFFSGEVHFKSTCLQDMKYIM